MNQYRITPFLLLLGLLSIGLSSCQDKVVRSYEANAPIYQSLEDWRQTTFEMTDARALQHPGKIYIYQNYLIVNELFEGVHFFDNSNPASPISLGFLPVHANVDMAIKDNVLYLDSYYDLLAFDITNIQSPQLLGRVMDVFDFEDYGYIAGYDNAYPMSYPNPELGVVVGWEIGKVSEEYDSYRGGCWGCEFQNMDALTAFANPTSVGPGSVGIAGSTSRFAIYENALYTLQPWRLSTFDIADRIPVHVSDESTRWNSETLFPAQGHLFVGTTNGMLIYNLDNPLVPTFRSDYGHVFACDPVVVAGNRAYVTLSSARTCNQNLNLLEVIDISNLDNPFLIKSYPMTNPRGLGVDGSTLFVCDGPDGLKVYDRTDDNAIVQNVIALFPGITPNDLIPYRDVLIATAEEGIFQYDYSNTAQISQLSLIPIQP